MKFPSEILPNSCRKIISCDISQFSLIRSTTSIDIGELQDPLTGLIKDIHICNPTEHVNDLSTNLYGIFKLRHLFIELTKMGKVKYNHYCEPNRVVEIPTHNVDFTLNTNKHYWTIKVGNIHNTHVKYQRSNIDMDATCIVEHSPMLWNFWHFSIRWRTEDGMWHTLNEPQKRSLSKRLKHEARTHIKMFAKLEEPVRRNLNKNCYENRKPTILKNIKLLALVYLLKRVYTYITKRKVQK